MQQTIHSQFVSEVIAQINGINLFLDDGSMAALTKQLEVFKGRDYDHDTLDFLKLKMRNTTIKAVMGGLFDTEDDKPELLIQMLDCIDSIDDTDYDDSVPLHYSECNKCKKYYIENEMQVFESDIYCKECHDDVTPKDY